MGLTKSLPPIGRGTALAVEGACVTLGSCNLRGMGFALCLCNTKAKLAINKTINKNLQERINIAPLVDLKERENSDELYKKWKISNA